MSSRAIAVRLTPLPGAPSAGSCEKAVAASALRLPARPDTSSFITAASLAAALVSGVRVVTTARWMPSKIFAVDASTEAGVNIFLSSAPVRRSEEHTSELQSLMRISYAVFCLKKKKHHNAQHRCDHLQPK